MTNLEIDSHSIGKIPPDIAEMLGKRYNFWLVYAYCGERKTKSGDTIHLISCRCKCRALRDMNANHVKFGRSRSCDCHYGNSRQNMKITFQGRMQSFPAWSKELGLSQGCLYRRIVINRWSIKKAFTTPPPERLFCYNGRRQTVTAWSRELGIDSATIQEVYQAISILKKEDQLRTQDASPILASRTQNYPR